LAYFWVKSKVRLTVEAVGGADSKTSATIQTPSFSKVVEGIREVYI
jgi:hypothetical protein